MICRGILSSKVFFLCGPQCITKRDRCIAQPEKNCAPCFRKDVKRPLSLESPTPLSSTLITVNEKETRKFGVCLNQLSLPGQEVAREIRETDTVDYGPSFIPVN